ncbi:MAG TPA: hypothetical protein VK629_15450 [Steroidobacteraceae bacterium]|nr:hypothetical protein [Steroidobacteraceae bacterium]
MTLALKLRDIGEDIVRCTDRCSGIACDQAKGIFPRGLILEAEEAHGRGAMIVGMNLGRSDENERAYYCENGAAYDSLLAYWSLRARLLPYYTKARALVRATGVLGPLLWSDVAKCENALAASTSPPLQTLRHCSRRFLQRELAIVPPDWPIFALGLDAYNALAYMIPTRSIIGVPHPTGAYGPFAGLWSGGALTFETQRRIALTRDADDPRAVWLGKVRAGA